MVIGTAAAIIGGAALSAGASVLAGSKAAKAQKNAAKQSADAERYMYDTTRADQAPYRDVGQGALYKLADMYGVSRPVDGGGVQNAGVQNAGLIQNGFNYNRLGGMFGSGALPQTAQQQPQQQRTAGYDGFQASPGYEFRRDEGVKAVERSAAARGLLGSGGTVKAIDRYAEGLASSEYENYANALRSMAGLGQTSTQATSSAGQSAANGISNAFTNAGNARASSYETTGQAINGGVSNVLGAYLRGGFGGGGVSVPGYGMAGGAALPMPGYGNSLSAWG
jgi:hypothetical protein